MRVKIKPQKLLFQHSEPAKFTQGRWAKGNRVSKAYLLFKWFIALFMLANLVLSIWFNQTVWRGSDNTEKYMIFATHWGLILIVLSLNLDAILVFARYSDERSKNYIDKTTPHYEKNHFFVRLSIWLTATAYPAALFITLVFWGFLFDYSKSYNFDIGGYLNLAVHLLQSIIALVDTFVSARPWRLWHCWCPIVFGAAYLIFNVTYVVAFNGTNTNYEDFVYNVLDWNNDPGMSAVFVVISMVAIPILFAIFYGEAKLRDLAWSRWSGYNPYAASEDNVASLNNSRHTGVYTISIKLNENHPDHVRSEEGVQETEISQ